MDKRNLNTIGNYWLIDYEKYSGESFKQCEKSHALDFDHLRLISSSESQVERICKKMNPKLTWAIEIDIAVIKPILEEENILPKDIADEDAINWLLENCYGIKVKKEGATK